MFWQCLVIGVLCLVAVLVVWRVKRNRQLERVPLEPFRSEPAQPETPKRHRLMVVGLGFTEVEPGAIAWISVTPQRFFVAKMLSIPGSIAADFAVLDCAIGAVHVGPTVPVTCAAFAESSALDWPPAEIGQPITLQVQNLTRVRKVFCGMLVGTGQRPELESDIDFGRARCIDLEGYSDEALTAAEGIVGEMPASPVQAAALARLRGARSH